MDALTMMNALVGPLEPVAVTLDVEYFHVAIPDRPSSHTHLAYVERDVECAGCGLVRSGGKGELMIRLASGIEGRATCCLACAERVSDDLDLARASRAR